MLQELLHIKKQINKCYQLIKIMDLKHIHHLINLSKNKFLLPLIYDKCSYDNDCDCLINSI